MFFSKEYYRHKLHWFAFESDESQKSVKTHMNPLPEAIFEPVAADWKRKPYFDYYYYTIKTKYNVNHHIDITRLLDEIKKRGLKFYPVYLYIVIRIINQNEAFRMGFNNDVKLGTWSHVVPSYTIFHNDDKTFSDIWSEYTPVFGDFYRQVVDDINRHAAIKKIKARENRPANFCPISTIPWLSFHSISQDTYADSSMLFPIIRFGKYYVSDDKMLLPFSIFVNHAVADGYHVSKLINEIEELGRNVGDWLKL